MPELAQALPKEPALSVLPGKVRNLKLLEFAGQAIDAGIEWGRRQVDSATATALQREPVSTRCRGGGRKIAGQNGQISD